MHASASSSVSASSFASDCSRHAGPSPGAIFARGAVCYRVWAPDHRRVRVRVEESNAGPRELELEREEDGHFSGEDPRGRPGDLYRYVLGGGDEGGGAELVLPDPASRFQPHGVEGPSQVVDPAAYAWRAASWRRPPMRGRVIYELHVGTFTREGTYAAAARRLDALVELGVNTIELMPLADFAGERNWGYDGVMPFAPARCYGAPDDLRALVDAAHARGLAVLLDVVYNHLGPCGAVLGRYAAAYFHESRHTVWGGAFDYSRAPVRAFFLENVRMWLDEYRVDGLRLDATHAIEDDSPRHLVAEIAELARSRGALVNAEDDRNEARVISPEAEGGWGLDAVWADDFHHTVRVALTRQQEAHFASFTGELAECVRTLREGWLYEGQVAPHRGASRGTPAGGRPPERFVHCISNHDQVGNRPLGERLHDSVSPEAYRALSMLLCLTPYTPLLFMGQEWAAGAPFLFFTDHPPEVGAGIAEGRRREFAHYGARYDARTLARMPDPQDEATFLASRLDWEERGLAHHAEVLALYQACLGHRARHHVFQNPPRERWQVEQVSDNVLGLRWREAEGDWLLLVGLAPGRSAVPMQGLAERARGRSWRVALYSNDAAFGGDAGRGATSFEGGRVVFSTPGALLLREA